jgi:glycosyltransferase involved in cell wall biosynthesis
MVVKRIGGTGGLQLQARHVARRLIDRGIACEIVAHERRPLKHDAGVTPEGVPLHTLVARRSPGFWMQLLRFMQERRASIDVVHVHGFGGESLMSALAAHRAGRKPLVVKPSTAGPGTKLTRWSHAARRTPALGALIRAGVTRWVAISDQTREDLLRLGVAHERIALIPNGVDTELFRPAGDPERHLLRARFDAPGDTPIVISISRLAAHKRVDLLIRAFHQTLPRMPEARLWLIGQGEERRTLERLVCASGLGDRVTLLGAIPRNEVVERLRAADIYVLCSRWEGLSNALLEAMATETPVLATRVSGTEDLIVSGENGLLIRPDDQAALARGLLQLAGERDVARRLGRGARETIMERFSLEATAQSLARLYDECVRDLPG